MEEGEESPLELPGYECQLTSAGRGKGIATYYKVNVFTHELDSLTRNTQITKFSTENLDVINVYRSSDGNSVELLSKLIDMMTTGKAVLITGDFNICMMNHEKNRLSKGLMENEKFSQFMTEPTHIQGGHIDHVYWRNFLDM